MANNYFNWTKKKLACGSVRFFFSCTRKTDLKKLEQHVIEILISLKEIVSTDVLLDKEQFKNLYDIHNKVGWMKRKQKIFKIGNVKFERNHKKEKKM